MCPVYLTCLEEYKAINVNSRNFFRNFLIKKIVDFFDKFLYFL